MSSGNYFRKRRQLVEVAGQLKNALERVIPDKVKIEALYSKLVALISELRAVMSRLEMRRLLMASGIVLSAQLIPVDTSGQQFSDPVTNPFGLTGAILSGFLEFADIDADGDLDLFIGGYSAGYSPAITYFQNTGDANSPQYADPEINPFGIDFNFYAYYAMPLLADLDDDGDYDLLVSTGYGFYYFENTGDAETPEFAQPVENPFGIVPVNYYNGYVYSNALKPTAADIDGDGDLDLIVGSYYNNVGQYGDLVYYENIGTVQNPEFAEPVLNPFGLSSPGYSSFPTFADLDNDGDFDLVVGTVYTYELGLTGEEMFYYENTGSKTAPEFSAPQINKFGMRGAHPFGYPAFADIDDDGDLDLFVGTIDEFDYDYGATLFQENIGTSAVVGPDVMPDLAIYPNPASDCLYIRTDVAYQSVMIMDAAGVLHSVTNQRPVPVAHMAPGVATLFVIDDEKGIATRQFVIVR